MQLSSQGIAIIKNFEGLSLSAYRDEAGVWTIGYGFTRYHDGQRVKPGDNLASEQQAAALLSNTLGQYVDAVNQYVSVPLSQPQFDALVSFTYNVGTGGLQESTLLRELNKKDYQAAADQFLVWDKVTDPNTGQKVVSAILADRRKEERQLFLSSPAA